MTSSINNVVVMQKDLSGGHDRPEPGPVPIRAFEPDQDVARWNALWERVSPELGLKRNWSEHELAVEFAAPRGKLRRPAWLATSHGDGSESVVGAISLTMPSHHRDCPYVHWLLVHPEWRRRGLGSSLLATAESYCRQQGWSSLRLETHRRWEAALAFYRRHRYEFIHE